MTILISLCIQAIFISTLFSDELAEISHLSSFVDEASIIAIFTLSLLTERLDTTNRRILFISFGFFVFVCLASPQSPYYRGLYLTIVDIALFLKPILLYVGLTNLRPKAIRQVAFHLKPFAYTYIGFAALFYLLNLLLPLLPSEEIRFGIESYSFISDNPGEFSNLIFALGIFAFALASSGPLRLLFAGIMVFLLLTTLRFKAFVLAAILLILMSGRKIGIIERLKSIDSHGRQSLFTRLRLKRIAMVLPFGLLLGVNQFIQYFFEEVTPRLLLLQHSIILARDFFPLGAGAGTYGSAVAKMFYSPLYVDLGFLSFWGLGEDDSRFLSDSFWPMVLGQYGIIGLIIVIWLYSIIVIKYLRAWSINSRRAIASMAIIINLALSTLGSAILIGNIGAILIATLILVNDKSRDGRS